VLRIVLHPAFDGHGARLRGKFVAVFGGRQLCVSREPLLAASRVLLAEGTAPETPPGTQAAIPTP
jgi:hypothetical protein